MREKFKGCLLGTAVGDALGSSRGEFSGRWTDDTHMTMGLAQSLVERGGFDGEHLAWTFLRNYEREPWRGYAPGPPTVFSLLRAGVPWNEASRHLFGGRGSYGNGAAMRVAPVGLLYHDDPVRLREVAEAQSLLTHAHELGREGAVLQARAVSLALLAPPPSSFDPFDFLEELESFTSHPVYLEKLGRGEEDAGGGGQKGEGGEGAGERGGGLPLRPHRPLLLPPPLRELQRGPPLRGGAGRGHRHHRGHDGGPERGLPRGGGDTRGVEGEGGEEGGAGGAGG